MNIQEEISTKDNMLRKLVKSRGSNLPDSYIVSAQIRVTSGTCGFNAYQMWADSMLLSGLEQSNHSKTLIQQFLMKHPTVFFL